jgi:hypothetical protein
MAVVAVVMEGERQLLEGGGGAVERVVSMCVRQNAADGCCPLQKFGWAGRLNGTDAGW